jgi:hypothetical protein
MSGTIVSGGNVGIVGIAGMGMGIGPTEILGPTGDMDIDDTAADGCSVTSVGTTGNPSKPVFVKISPCCNVGAIVFSI